MIPHMLEILVMTAIQVMTAMPAIVKRIAVIVTGSFNKFTISNIKNYL
jgi:hypothetical protein